MPAAIKISDEYITSRRFAMPAKKLTYSEEARKSLRAGIDALASSVRVTLGPRDAMLF